ncbi:LuxR family transcriptional activator of bioluminescence operon [Aeromonas sp. BIGb0405]|uniref:LuxR family transcriptional regulator n=1 Tax=unclassified Aeromonas TaxID=257493 RepID=UPI0021685D76|nr:MULTISPECIES: LuxR family transcriptional regulator [unclassified Aeromonas]MCS3456714.1 LuxR family transcriptional activator of bioluminescence operon [Aeromonas sp. BIGb0405]MCS3461065.1 LuxR family transcriptional activator of bioluminescence operon [Aeromonas sp. BIGb0445]
MKQAQLLEYLELFTRVMDGDQLSELIGRFALGMGYDYYRFALILPMSMQRPKVVLFNRCPDSWIQAYTAHHMLARDPIIQLARHQTLPIYWNQLDEKASFLQAGSLDVMSLAAEFGLRNGISFPLHGPTGESGILSFITRERASSDLLLESSPVLSWMSTYIFDAALRTVRLGLPAGVQQEVLTGRETECLSWASEGKTSGEIASILGITERTVNYHLNQVTRKTGSINRYQAIAKGMSSGILVPNLEEVVVTNFPRQLQ